MVTFMDLAAEPEPVSPFEDQALAVLQQLRPDLDAAKWAAVRSDPVGQRPRFTVLIDHDAVGAVAGWRLLASTASGRTLYVDDLVSDAAVRSRGHGSALLAHLRERAEHLGASLLALDSGVARFDAHRFYCRERMWISSHHFVRNV